jgi:hypothetical protein
VPLGGLPVPRLPLDDIEAIAGFVVDRCGLGHARDG